jgi:alkylated DNA repair dioxygenase AlkB
MDPVHPSKKAKITDVMGVEQKSDPKQPVFETILDVQEGELHAVVTYSRSFLSRSASDALLAACKAPQRALITHSLFTFRGRKVQSPRLICAFGDAGLTYRYTGVEQQAQPWFPALTAIRDQVQTLCTHPLNYALINMYRDGMDYISWHSDNETDLVPGATICSVSLGASRTFFLKKKKASAHQDVNDRKVELVHNSVLLMKKDTQRLYLHSVPKRKKLSGMRINVTFHSVVVPSTPSLDLSNAERGTTLLQM